MFCYRFDCPRLTSKAEQLVSITSLLQIWNAFSGMRALNLIVSLFHRISVVLVGFQDGCSMLVRVGTARQVNALEGRKHNVPEEKIVCGHKSEHDDDL